MIVVGQYKRPSRLPALLFHTIFITYTPAEAPSSSLLHKSHPLRLYKLTRIISYK